MFLFDSSMSISAFATFSFIKTFHLNEFPLFVLGNNHLCNTLPLIYNEIFLREIDEQYHDFTTIVCIDCSRSIEHSNAMLQSKTGKCTYTIAKTGDWSAAYEYANEAVVAAKKTVPQVTGVAAVLKSAKKAEVTWAPVAEAAGYTVSYISADTELQVTDDTWKTGKAVVAVVNRKDYGSDEAFEAACEKYGNT